MIGWEFPPHHSGGLGVACQGLVSGLHEHGVNLTFTLPKMLPGGAAFAREAWYSDPDPRLDIVAVNAVLSPYDRLPQNPTRVQAVDMIEEVHHYAQVVAELAKLEEHPPEVVHAHDWMSIPAGLRTREAVRKPLVLHVHSTEYDRAGANHTTGPIAEIEYQGMQQADAIIAVSEYTKQLLMHQYGVDGSKVHVVHNGIDPNPDYHNQTLEAFLRSRPVVSFVGRLTIQKGPEYFLAVAKAVIDRRPDAVFVLAGSGDMYQHLLVTTAQSELSGSVLFAGFLRDKEKYLLYQRSDVFIMPSVSEPFGISALEAALSRTPVIVSKQAGVHEVLPNTIQVDFWDIDKMAQTVLELLDDGPRRQENGHALSQQAQAQTWHKAAQGVQQVYDQVKSQ